MAAQRVQKVLEIEPEHAAAMALRDRIGEAERDHRARMTLDEARRKRAAGDLAAALALLEGFDGAHDLVAAEVSAVKAAIRKQRESFESLMAEARSHVEHGNLKDAHDPMRKALEALGAGGESGSRPAPAAAPAPRRSKTESQCRLRLEPLLAGGARGGHRSRRAGRRRWTEATETRRGARRGSRARGGRGARDVADPVQFRPGGTRFRFGTNRCAGNGRCQRRAADWSGAARDCFPFRAGRRFRSRRRGGRSAAARRPDPVAARPDRETPRPDPAPPPSPPPAAPSGPSVDDLLANARTVEEAGDIEAALDLYATVLSREADNATATAGQERLQARMAEQTVRERLRDANAAFAEGRFDDARRLFQEAFDLNAAPEAAAGLRYLESVDALACGDDAACGTLVLRVEPAAAVIVNDRALGTAAALRLPLPAGRHRIRLETDDWRFPRTIRIAAGLTAELDVVLERDGFPR